MIRKIHILFTAAAVALIATSACKKTSVTPKIPVVSKSDTDVYVVGYTHAANGNQVATYWKNGVAFRLADSLTESRARAILIKGTDIYIAGYMLGKTHTGDDYFTVACYWKNGVVTRLDNGPNYSDAYGITLIGNDVCVAGNISDDNFSPHATYWINGVVTKLPEQLPDNGSDAYCVATDGTSVYVGGDAAVVTGSGPVGYAWMASSWKDGGPLNLQAVPKDSQAYGIAVNGSDVYMAGFVTPTPVVGNHVSDAAVWKNGVATLLMTDPGVASATSIVISNNDIYVAGYVWGGSSDYAVYWKNGVMTKLGEGSGATAITLAGSDVYVAGTLNQATPNSTSIYWKNGTQVTLPKGIYGNSEAFGIAVLVHD